MKMHKVVFITLLIQSQLMSKHVVYPKAALKGLNSALTLLTRISELFITSSEKNDLEHLITEIAILKKDLKITLNSILQKLDMSTYQCSFTGYINKINSCKDDYRHYVDNPSDETEKILSKCTDIMESVRPLGNYLTGISIADAPPLLDLYKNSKGACNGHAIDSIFMSIFADFVTGCTIASTIARLENIGPSYSNECKKRMSNITDYLTGLYISKCAPLSCKSFHCFVQRLVSDNSTISSTDLHKKLSEEYPWFNFLIFKLSKEGQVTDVGNFSIRRDDDHLANKHKYVIYFFDSGIQLAKESNNYSLVIEVSQNFLVDHDFGNSTLTRTDGVNNDIFNGFAPESNMLCLDISTKEDESECVQTSSSKNLSPSNFSILFSIVLTLAIKILQKFFFENNVN